jgi:hypothetical protein
MNKIYEPGKVYKALKNKGFVLNPKTVVINRGVKFKVLEVISSKEEKWPEVSNFKMKYVPAITYNLLIQLEDVSEAKAIVCDLMVSKWKEIEECQN